MSMKKPICKNCGENECMEYPAPHETIISVPFTKIEIRVWNWAKPQFADLCSECAIDRDNANRSKDLDAAWDDGFETGFDKAMKEARYL